MRAAIAGALCLPLILGCAGVWEGGVNDAVVETMEQLDTLVKTCDGPGQPALLNAIEATSVKAGASKVGVMALVGIDEAVRNAASDGTIDDNEAAKVAALVDAL